MNTWKIADNKRVTITNVISQIQKSAGTQTVPVSTRDVATQCDIEEKITNTKETKVTQLNASPCNGHLTFKQCLSAEALLCRETLRWFWESYDPQDCYSEVEVARAQSAAASHRKKPRFNRLRRNIRRLSNTFRMQLNSDTFSSF